MRRTLVVVLIMSFVLGPQAAVEAVPPKARLARVTHVSDGDTAYLKPLRYGSKAASWPGRKARFIGVDTPEIYSSPPDCYGAEASAFTEKKLAGKRVKITYGKDPLDPYDRALIYIWLRGKFFNAMLVRKGFARVEIYAPNDRYEARLLRAQQDAKDHDRGLWGAC